MIEPIYRHTFTGEPHQFDNFIEGLNDREKIIANIVYKMDLFRHRKPTLERLREYSQLDKEEVVEILKGLHAKGIIEEVETSN